MCLKEASRIAVEGGASVGGGVASSAQASVVRIIQPGESIADIINEAKGLTFSTGNEHALVALENGDRALVSGGEYAIAFDELPISRIFGHTHPTNALPSQADVDALGQLGNSKQYVFHGGQITVVRRGY